jgi:hypothetical protein
MDLQLHFVYLHYCYMYRNMFNKPQLAFQEHSKKIKTLDQWITAFSIYMTIYCQLSLDITLIESVHVRRH